MKTANIAQTINVLQATILSDKEKLIVTPTSYVFELYVPHQDVTLLPSELTCTGYTLGNDRVPGLSRLGAAEPSWPHPPAPRFPSA